MTALANKNFKVYQASAGSGKTYTIVKEYLECCLHDESSTDNFRHILAITFTNMAANEMKSKIIHHLNDIINSDLNQPAKGMEKDLVQELHIERTALKKNAAILFQKILHDYSNFYVCTIDNFVQKLARPFAKELQLPNRYMVSIDDTNVADAITEKIGEKIGTGNPLLTKILEDYHQRLLDDEHKPMVEHNLHLFIIDQFSESAYQKNEQNHLTQQDQYEETEKFLQSKVNDFEKRCQQFAEDFGAFYQDHQLSKDDFNGKSNNPSLSLWNKIKQKKYEAPTNTMLHSLDPDYNWIQNAAPAARVQELEKLTPEYNNLYIKFLQYYKSNFGPYLFYKKQLSKLSLYALRSIIRAEIEDYIKEEQVVHISEFNKRIHDVMGDFSVPFLYERIGEHIKHLFVDEFQDTSILQWQNLIPLIDNNLSDGNMNMVVGDGKQSIYRWRNGEVEQIVSLPKIFHKPSDNPTFDSFENTFCNNFNFNELKCNFRSFDHVVSFNNDFFEYCTQHSYLEEQARKVYIDDDGDTGKEVSVRQICQQKEKGLVQVELYDPKKWDRDNYPARIKELIEELHQQGFNNKDITVLVRTNNIGSTVANYLTDNGISVVSSDSLLLKSSNKVQLIIHTLDYLIHPDNPCIVSTVLYYWHASHQEKFDGVIDHFFDQANAIAKGKHSIEKEMSLPEGTLQSLLGRSVSLYDLCAALARTYGFNSTKDSYLNFLLDSMFTWQSTNQNDIESFLSYWEKKSKQLSVITNNSDAVTIMTIHKSKGLEFPVVIYPYAIDNLEYKKGDTIWIEPETLGFEAIPNIDKVQFDINGKTAQWTPQTHAIVEHETGKTRLDNLNVNYVAFTRAVQRLYILTDQVEDTDKSPLNSYVKAHQKYWVDESGNPDADLRILYRLGDAEEKKVEKEEQRVSLSDFHDAPSCEWFDKISIDPDPSMFWISKEDKMKPQEWGEFVHQVLSEVRQGQDIDPALQPYLDAGVIDTKTAAGLRDLFEQMVHHPVIGKAFLPEALVKNECEILSQSFGILRPDRYAELPDKIYLLDYKTGSPSEQHHKQLQRYASVLKKMVHKEIEAYLVYLGNDVEVVAVDLTH